MCEVVAEAPRKTLDCSSQARLQVFSGGGAAKQISRSIWKSSTAAQIRGPQMEVRPFGGRLSARYREVPVPNGRGQASMQMPGALAGSARDCKEGPYATVADPRCASFRRRSPQICLKMRDGKGVLNPSTSRTEKNKRLDSDLE